MQTVIQINKRILIILLTSLGLSFMLLTDQATAQTPVTKIENAAGDSVLTIFEDGGFAVYGEEFTGTIPVTGEGARLMWHPAKAAFRAGETDGSQWEDANIGSRSVALGSDTEASGEASFAMGFFSIASGEYSAAIGRQAIASGEHSIGLGFGATASGDESTALGAGTTASGITSTAMGHDTEANAPQSTAMGWETKASGHESTAMGFRTVAATEYSLTIGANNAANRGNDDNDQTTGPLFVVGNGTSVTSRSDALVLHQNGDMVISGSLTQNSDRRLKNNINPLGDGILGKLSTITPSSFEFKNQQTHPAGPQIGLIAQEVQQQFPELVSKGTSGSLSVSYSKFTAVLLKGLQEQQQTIESQQTTIDQLQEKTRRIAALEKKVSDIKQNRQMAGLPVSTIGLLLLGIAIGGGFWWQSSAEKSRQN